MENAFNQLSGGSNMADGSRSFFLNNKWCHDGIIAIVKRLRVSQLDFQIL